VADKKFLQVADLETILQIEILEQNGCEYYKEPIKKLRQDRYEELKKQIQTWEENGEEKSTIIDKIWTACQPLS
jgi:hypothetical protein